jgi:hypothetical protein
MTLDFLLVLRTLIMMFMQIERCEVTVRKTSTSTTRWNVQSLPQEGQHQEHTVCAIFDT